MTNCSLSPKSLEGQAPSARQDKDVKNFVICFGTSLFGRTNREARTDKAVLMVVTIPYDSVPWHPSIRQMIPPDLLSNGRAMWQT